MAWEMSGTYFENCSCDAICPCTWSGFAKPATSDRCRFLMAFHVDRGTIEGVDVSGLGFAMIGDTPQAMTDGNWRVGAFVDVNADEAQREKLVGVISGSLGGPLATIGPLLGEFLGVAYEPIDFTRKDGRIGATIGADIDVEVEEFVAQGASGPAHVDNSTHPAASTLTIAPAVRSRISGFGISFPGEGKSGFTAPFSWSG